jgi:hypothetical protein
MVFTNNEVKCSGLYHKSQGSYMPRTAHFGAVGLAVILLLCLGVQMMRAATIHDIKVTCQYVTVSGKTELNTSYMRVQVVLASNLTTMIAQQVVSTHEHLRSGADYQAKLDVRKAHLAEGTLLVISAGEWDGTKYLQPARIVGETCGTAPTRTPFPGTLTPTFGFSPTPTSLSLTATPLPTATLLG